MTEYLFAKSPVALDRLAKEISDSSIVTAMDSTGMSVSGDQLTIRFKSALSQTDEYTLGDIVGAHSGEPLTIPAPAQEVVTQFELNDKTLKICGERVLIDQTEHKGRIDFLVPGTPGSGDSRWVSGGMAWVHPYSPTARIRVWVSDEDNILGYGAGTVVRSYTDGEQPEGRRNWYFPPIGHVEAETIGGYGEIPAGLYLVVEFEDDAGGAYGYCNLEWGKKE